MKKMLASVLLLGLAMPVLATLHPTKGEKEAFGAGVVVGLAFNKRVRTNVGKAGKAAGKHVYRFVTFRK